MKRNDNAMYTGTFCRANKCAKIVRIFNFIEYENKRRFILLFSDGKNFLNLCVTIRVNDCDNTLR